MPSHVFRVSILVFTCFWGKLIAEWTTGTFFTVEPESALIGHVVSSSNFYSELECGWKCVTMEGDCKSFNYIEEPNQTTKCEINNMTKHSAPTNDFVRQQYSKYLEPMNAINEKPVQNLPETTTKPTGQNYSATDGEWTLIARFSNADVEHWMEDQGTWWYDRKQPYGNTHDLSANTDMISEAFWLKNGTEFRITKSDDPTHTALLTTTGNCLEGKSFRSKLTGYGAFRGSASWANDECRGKCSVVYNGSYLGVDGFQDASCDGEIQQHDEIGFYCQYEEGDGSVLMIGGGGSSCHRADHGLGITEADYGAFKYYTNASTYEGSEYDFGNNAWYTSQVSSYSLNLWVR